MLYKNGKSTICRGILSEYAGETMSLCPGIKYIFFYPVYIILYVLKRRNNHDCCNIYKWYSIL